MCDWVDQESDARQETRTPTGRCSHGFLAGLCVMPRCRHAEPRPTRNQRSTRVLLRTNRPAPDGFYCCTRCGLTKPIEEFYVSRQSKMGHQSRCKPCDNLSRTESNRRRKAAL
jgi:hypothetical protein